MSRKYFIVFNKYVESWKSFHVFTNLLFLVTSQLKRYLDTEVLLHKQMTDFSKKRGHSFILDTLKCSNGKMKPNGRVLTWGLLRTYSASVFLAAESIFWRQAKAKRADVLINYESV